MTARRPESAGAGVRCRNKSPWPFEWNSVSKELLMLWLSCARLAFYKMADLSQQLRVVGGVVKSLVHASVCTISDSNVLWNWALLSCFLALRAFLLMENTIFNCQINCWHHFYETWCCRLHSSLDTFCRLKIFAQNRYYSFEVWTDFTMRLLILIKLFITFKGRFTT